MKKSKVNLEKEKAFLADADKWDSGEFGRDDAHVRVADPKYLIEIAEIFKIESTYEFFAKGKKLASLADKGLLKEESNTITFEDAEDLETISIHLPKDLITDLQLMADFHKSTLQMTVIHALNLHVEQARSNMGIFMTEEANDIIKKN